ELEVSRSLALAFVALIAVLPEYAVDFVFAWNAASDPAQAHYATANMTGSNRLLIGFGWAVVALLFWNRRRRQPLLLDPRQKLEMTFLLLATGWAFTIFFRTLVIDGPGGAAGSLNIVDSIVLVALFVAYMAMSSRGKAAEEHEVVVGPMAAIAALPRPKRRLALLLMFIVPAVVIFSVAEPFAESLVATGKDVGVDEFFLVQWVAPLASEAPEIGIAFYFAIRGMGAMAMGVLISSKVNQWTMLVGTLPIVYSVSLGALGQLPMDTRQVDEFLITAAQSLFAVLLIVAMRMYWPGAVALLLLFIIQFFFTGETGRLVFSSIYLGLAFLIMAASRARRQAAWNMLAWAAKGFRAPGPAPVPGEA
ncbi:MAG: hypothetical protein HY261_07025, partial [Chloroflexi bacterium]|nr:hypothetical protein [Chloroflexota bacterium]